MTLGIAIQTADINVDIRYLYNCVYVATETSGIFSYASPNSGSNRILIDRFTGYTIEFTSNKFSQISCREVFGRAQRKRGIEELLFNPQPNLQ